MAGNITTTQVANGIQVAMAKESLPRLNSDVILPKLINRDYDTEEIARHGQVIDITKRGVVTRQAKASGSAVTLQNPSDAKVYVTLDKFYETSFLMEDLAKAFAKPDYFDGYASDGVAALLEGIETDIIAKFADLTGTTQAVGALSNWGKDDLIAMRKKLRVAKAPKANPKNLVIDPEAYAKLLDTADITSAEKVGSNGVLRQGTENMSGPDMDRFGMSIYEHNMLEITGSPATCTGAAFDKNAIVLVSRPLPLDGAGKGVEQRYVTDPVTGLVFRITVSYSHTYLGMMCTIDTLYGVKAIRPELGLKVTYTN